MIDFSIPPDLERARQAIDLFMHEHVYPNEERMVEHEGLPLQSRRCHSTDLLCYVRARRGTKDSQILKSW